MMNKLLEKILEKTLQFREQEDGLALTEYLILLAVVAGAVITAATAFSTTLEAQWTALTSEIFDAL
ncbi:MAG: Flp family type IVb pilin [Pseudomonadales bacterium]|jgi:pilus assembly protein Flp/PilA